MKISVSMIVLNEAKNIARALSSCSFADEIVIVGGGYFFNVRSSSYDWIGTIPYPESMQDFYNIEGTECDYGFFPVIRRGCFEKVGFADEQFKHYFVDPDFGYRIQRAGYKNICCPTSVIIHHDLGKKREGASERFESDRTRFFEKWGLYKIENK